MPPVSASLVLRLVAYTALLFASWNHNVFSIPTGVWGWGYRAEPRVGHVGPDSSIVLARLRVAADGAVPWHFPLVSRFDGTTPVGYPSQFGGQGVLLAALQQAIGADPRGVGVIAATATAFLAALLYAGIFVTAGLRFGPLTGDLAALLMAFVPSMLYLAPSPYWMLPLLIAPFALVWQFGGCVVGSSRAWYGLLTGVALLLFAKCLCGYEFVSTVILATMAALWYHQSARGVPWVRRWRGLVALGLAGTLGFTAALGCHAVQIASLTDENPFTVIAGRAAARTLADQGRDQTVLTFEADWFPFLPDHVSYPANAVVKYFRQPALSASSDWSRHDADVPMKYLLLTALAAAVAWRRFPPGLPGAALGGIVAALGWLGVAINHTCTHTHLDRIVFDLAFTPLALMLVGWLVQQGAMRLRLAHVLPGVLAALALSAAAFSLWRADQRAGEAFTAETRATDHVRALGAALPEGQGVRCHVEVFTAEENVLDLLRLEMGRMPVVEPLSEREPMLMAIGWALDDQALRPFRAPRVVVQVDGESVPAWIARYGRKDIDALVGCRATGAGFMLAVPRRHVPAGAVVRVVAVSAVGEPRAGAEIVPMGP